VEIRETVVDREFYVVVSEMGYLAPETSMVVEPRFPCRIVKGLGVLLPTSNC